MAAKTETRNPTLKPDLYMEATGRFQICSTAHALDLLQASFPTGPTGDQQFMDLGCGTGHVTREALLPRCSPCRRIVAVDVSLDMVEYAREHFAHPKICYEVMDILADDLSDFVERHGKFDRVYSLFCFNWVRDQAKAFRNVGQLMRPGAEALFLIYSDTAPMRFRQKLRCLDRWKRYAKVIEDSIPPSHNLTGSDELVSYTLILLKDAGLTPVVCEVKNTKSPHYADPVDIVQFLLASNPLTAILPPEEMPLLVEDVTKEATRLWADTKAGGSLLDRQVLVVRASKLGS